MTPLANSSPKKKTEQITEALRLLAAEAGPDARLPTYLELLNRFGVSRTTLNAALEGLEGQRVIYRRHGVGIFSAPRRQGQNIALVCNPLFFHGRNHSPFWDVLLSSARERATLDDSSCEVHFPRVGPPDELPFGENLRHSLLHGQLNGVVGVGMNRAVAHYLAQNQVHYVSFGGPGDWYVGIDFASLLHQGVRILAQQGCRRLALLCPVAPLKIHAAGQQEWASRTGIFRMALEQHGLPFESRLVELNLDLVEQEPYSTTLSHQEQGRRSVQRLLGGTGAERPDGLLFTDDVMAGGALAALRELNLQPGRELQVVTHSNRGTDVLAPWEDAITRLEVDPAEIVDSLFSTIAKLLSGEQPPGFLPHPLHGGMSHLVRPMVRPIVREPGA